MGSGQSQSEGKGSVDGLEQLTTFETGVQWDESCFTWKIKNFLDIFENDSLINSQKIDFSVGDKRDPSNWTMFLRSWNADDGKWIGLFYQVKRPSDSEPKVTMFTKCGISITNEAGQPVWERSSKIIDCYLPQNQKCGFAKMIKADSDLSFLVDESLVMNINFKIYESSEQTEYVTQKKRKRENENEDNEDSETEELEIKRVRVEA